MISPKLMEKAEARCLELVNDGPTYREYDESFKKFCGSYTANALRKVAEAAIEGDWDKVESLAGLNLSQQWAQLRGTRNFGRFNGVTQSTEFSRVVFGLVLEHWLRSNACSTPSPAEKQMMEDQKWGIPEPRKFKAGDTVRIMVCPSLSGGRHYGVGTIGLVTRLDTYNSDPCVVVGGTFYRPEDLELVTDEPVLVTPKVREKTGSIFADASNIPRIIIPKETAMSLKIETITFVNGSDISKLTVDSLVSLISSTEKEIEKLEALNSKPKKVLAKIAELKNGLAELVKHADAE